MKENKYTVFLVYFIGLVAIFNIEFIAWLDNYEL